MKQIVAITISITLLIQPIYVQAEGESLSEECSTESEKLNYFQVDVDEIENNADKFLGGVKDEYQHATDEIKKEAKQAAEDLVDEATEEVKKSIVDSIKEYFSDFSKRMKDFFRGIFGRDKGETGEEN